MIFVGLASDKLFRPHLNVRKGFPRRGFANIRNGCRSVMNQRRVMANPISRQEHSDARW